jgi:hypothetical protein
MIRTIHRVIRAIEVLKGDRITISQPQAAHLSTATARMAEQMAFRVRGGGTVDRATIVLEAALYKAAPGHEKFVMPPIVTATERTEYPMVAVPPTDWELN